MFTENLQTVMNQIEFLLINQQIKYYAVLEKARVQIAFILKISSFWHLTDWISSYALCKILKQYNKTLTSNAVLFFCTQIFSIILELLCSYIIQHWLCQGETLIFNDIHLHWHLKWISNFIFIIDLCLMIVNSLSIQSQSHSWCSRAQNSTQWDFSTFEVVKTVIERQQQFQRDQQWN